MDKKGNKVLIDFSAAIDTSYGVFRYLITSKKFKLTYFKDNVIRASDAYYKNMIVSSKEKNPLKLLLTDEYISSADEMYNELCTSYKPNVLKYSRTTDILKLTYTWKKGKDLGIECVLNCKDVNEYEYIHKILPNDYPVTLQEYDATNYDEIIIRDVIDLQTYQNLKQPHLCIYLLNIGINYDEHGMLRPEAYSYFPAESKVIDMYTGYRYCVPPPREEDDING